MSRPYSLIKSCTCRRESEGFMLQSSAAAPDTWGAATDVPVHHPEYGRSKPSMVGRYTTVEYTDTPGAATSMHELP